VRFLLLVGIGVLFGTGNWPWAVGILVSWVVLGWLVAWGLMYMVTNDAGEAAAYATLFICPPLAKLFFLKKRPKTEIVGIDISSSMPPYMLGDIIERWRHVDRIVGFDHARVVTLKIGDFENPDKIQCHGGSGYDALKTYVEAYGFQNVVVVDDGLCGPVPEGWKHEVV
jgi:hypothetical protein